MAQINYKDKRGVCDKYMLPKIAKLTLNGGLRADQGWTGLWLHIRNMFWHHLSEEQVREAMPNEFWQEFMKEANIDGVS